jgi:hypothetical protein
MDDLIKFLQNPAASAITVLIITTLGGVISLLINWLKDFSLLKEKSKFDRLEIAMNKLSGFLEKVVITVYNLNISHEEHAERTRENILNTLRGQTQKIIEESNGMYTDMPHVLSAYTTTRHYLSQQDRVFLDITYSRVRDYIGIAAKTETDVDRINAIVEFRIFSGCLYVALIKNMERLASHLKL